MTKTIPYVEFDHIYHHKPSILILESAPHTKKLKKKLKIKKIKKEEEEEEEEEEM